MGFNETPSTWLLWVILILAIWSVPWKGYALWTAAKKNHKGWFVALMIINTLAILEILYIYIFSREKEKAESK